MNLFKKADYLASLMLIGLIRIYQKTLSPDHSPLKYIRVMACCKYYPTCSEYGIDALKKKGVIKGVPLMVDRILRCNPWSEGGVDEVK